MPFTNGAYYRSEGGVETVCDRCIDNGDYERYLLNCCVDVSYEYWERMENDINDCVWCGIECRDLSTPKRLKRRQAV